MGRSDSATSTEFDFQKAVNSPQTPEIRPLTGIRGMAAWMVVVLHFSGVWAILLPSLEPMRLFRGYLGVDLFFILSGFILSYVHRPGSVCFGFCEYRKFIWLRMARIYPNHLAMLLVLIAMILGAHAMHVEMTGDYKWSELPFQLTMTHRFPFVPGGQWNFPSWSISAEWFAYLTMFPLCWHLLKRDWSAKKSLCTAYALLVVWLLISFYSHDAGTTPGKCWAIIHVSCEFIAGSLLFQACRKGGPFIDALRNKGTLLFVILLGLLAFPNDTGPILLFPLILASLTSERSWIARVFSSKPALWMGKVSYALYMCHGVMLKLLKILLPPEHFANCGLGVRMLLVLCEMLFLLGFAAALCFLIEIPARNFLRKWYNRKEKSLLPSKQSTSTPRC